MPLGNHKCCGTPFSDRHAPTCTAIKTRAGRKRAHDLKVKAENSQEKKRGTKRGLTPRGNTE